VPSPRARKKRKLLLKAQTLALTAFMAVGPIKAAHAYVDPNAAGPLYQLLFPLFIAISSAVAAFRSVIRRQWNRLMSALMATVRGKGLPLQSADPIDRL
jgi:hypothetical protein